MAKNKHLKTVMIKDQILTMEEALKLAEKALARRKKRQEARDNRKLRDMSGAELWNEFSNSNLRMYE